MSDEMEQAESPDLLEALPEEAADETQELETDEEEGSSSEEESEKSEQELAEDALDKSLDDMSDEEAEALAKKYPKVFDELLAAREKAAQAEEEAKAKQEAEKETEPEVEENPELKANLSEQFGNEEDKIDTALDVYASNANDIRSEAETLAYRIQATEKMLVEQGIEASAAQQATQALREQYGKLVAKHNELVEQHKTALNAKNGMGRVKREIERTPSKIIKDYPWLYYYGRTHADGQGQPILTPEMPIKQRETIMRNMLSAVQKATGLTPKGKAPEKTKEELSKEKMDRLKKLRSVGPGKQGSAQATQQRKETDDGSRAAKEWFGDRKFR